jgi:hypothetical protein
LGINSLADFDSQYYQIEANRNLARGLQKGQTMTKLYSPRESVKWQKDHQGRVIFGLDSMYAIARAGKIPVVRVGNHKIFFPESSLEKLMSGEVQA